MKSQGPENYSDVLKSLHNLLSDPEEDVRTLPIEEIKKDLEKEGIDVDQMISDVNLLVAKKQAELRLKAAKEKRLAFERLSEIKKGICAKANVKEAVLQIVESLKPSQPKLAAVCFRKLEEAKDEDMASILEDLMLLEDEDDVSE